MVRTRRFLRIVMIDERTAASKVDRPYSAWWPLVACLIDNVDLARYCTTHGAFVREPLRGRDRGEAVPFGASVVLVQDGSPPGDHLFFDWNRTGCRSVDGHLLARKVILAPRLVSQLEHPHKHGGDPLAVAHPISLDQPESLQRVKPVHDNNGATEPV